MTVRSLALALIAVTAVLPAQAEDVLRTVAELSDFANRLGSSRVSFDVTATVLESHELRQPEASIKGAALLEDRTGRAYVFVAPPSVPAPGSVMRFVGIGRVTNRVPSLWAAQMTPVGTAVLPEPASVALGDLSVAEHAYRVVRTEGTIIEVCRDEIDASNAFLLLKDDETILPVALASDEAAGAAALVGARVRVTGRYSHRIDGLRLFSGPYVGCQRLDVLAPPPADPFDVPVLDFRRDQSPRDISRLDRRRIDGRILAAWGADRALLRTAEGYVVNLELSNGVRLPRPGAAVRAAGYPQTDLYRINLVKADWKPAARDLPENASPRARRVTAGQLAPEACGRDGLLCHGELVSLDGRVSGARPPTADADGVIELVSDDGRSVRVICPRPAAVPAPEVGSKVRVTGVCCQIGDAWRPFMVFPHLRETFVVLRGPGDLVTLARPPWLTPARVGVLVALLVALLVAVAAWNRSLRRLAAKRGKALAREQLSHFASELKADERTRLAVEIHDTLSQNLAGATCLVATCRDAVAARPDFAQKTLRTAVCMLQSCHAELHNCLFDLRNDTLEETDFNAAIRKTLAPLLAPGVELAVRTEIPRAHFHDTTAHAILCIIRELVSNALRHGRATAVRVAGSRDGDRLVFSVTDNGAGFDPSSCPGPAEGHFGIDGIRDRLNRLSGALAYQSAPGRTRARFEIPLATAEAESVRLEKE